MQFVIKYSKFQKKDISTYEYDVFNDSGIPIYKSTIHQELTPPTA